MRAHPSSSRPTSTTPTAALPVQVWKDALASKQQSPYMAHTLAGGTLRQMAFCPYEVRCGGGG